MKERQALLALEAWESDGGVEWRWILSWAQRQSMNIA